MGVRFGFSYPCACLLQAGVLPLAKGRLFSVPSLLRRGVRQLADGVVFHPSSTIFISSSVRP